MRNVQIAPLAGRMLRALSAAAAATATAVRAAAPAA
jgi:hypothetical protein